MIEFPLRNDAADSIEVEVPASEPSILNTADLMEDMTRANREPAARGARGSGLKELATGYAGYLEGLASSARQRAPRPEEELSGTLRREEIRDFLPLSDS